MCTPLVNQHFGYVRFTAIDLAGISTELTGAITGQLFRISPIH